MAIMVKSLDDGCWYYDETRWNHILEYLCDAIDSFSESDKDHQIRIILDHCADEVSNIICKKNEC